MNEAAAAAAEAIVRLGASLVARGLTHGRTGNLSVRLGDGILVSPTSVSLGALDADGLATVTLDGSVRGDVRPSKEVFLHLAMYRARPTSASRCGWTG